MTQLERRSDGATVTPASVTSTRAPWLDAARGIAVVAMVIYHFSWNLSYFGTIDVDVAQHPGWRLFAKAIAGSFMMLAGYALVLAHGNGIRWPAFLKRLAILCGAALLVTIGSIIAFPDSFIFFGILHSIALCSVLALVALRLPWWALLLLAAAVFGLPSIFRSEIFNSPILLWTGLGTSVPLTNDYEPVFPWFAYMLAGMAVARFDLTALRAKRIVERPSLIERIGRWSLPIYLIHQPILFGLTMGAFRAGLI